MIIVPFTVHLVLLAELLQLTVLSLEKLSIKAVMQTTSDYYRCYLRVNSGATYYDRGIETKWIQSPVVDITILIVTTVMLNYSTKQFNLLT